MRFIYYFFKFCCANMENVPEQKAVQLYMIEPESEPGGEETNSESDSTDLRRSDGGNEHGGCESQPVNKNSWDCLRNQ